MQNSVGLYQLRNYDWWCVLVYILLVGFGLMSIHSASYIGSSLGDNISQKSTMQTIWICFSAIIATIILFSNKEIYYKYTPILYIVTITVLLLVIFFGKEVNGSRSWIGIGSFGVQPAEFGKVITALMLARFMSDYHFNIRKASNKLKSLAIIIVPIMLILLQNETGSALVYMSLVTVLYLEGLNKWYYIILLFLIALFIMSMLLTPETVLFVIILFAILLETRDNGNLRYKIIYISSFILTWLILIALNFWYEFELESYSILLISFAISTILIIIYWIKVGKSIIIYVISAYCAIIYVQLIDFLFDNVLQLHQQKRILDLLGIESDLKGWGYNVNQSKIAIGSGSFWGKGYMNGTQTKFNFVPEQSTDFIFCTIGEEFGFFGALGVITLFSILIFRLMRMASRVNDNFARIYTFGVVSILSTHLFINIGMTIGLVPIIGIPLPFFSYGGSSLLAFTILVFIAIRACVETRGDLYNKL